MFLYKENIFGTYTMNAHLDEDWFGDTRQPFMVKALRTKIWDFTQVNSDFIGSCSNLDIAKSETGARMQKITIRNHDMFFKGSK